MRTYLIPFLLLGLMLVSFTQVIPTNKDDGRSGTLTVMSYNVENLFDTINNSATDDDEFTPQGSKRWNAQRYYRKINNIAKIISKVGGLYWPSIVGLVEVENGLVIEDLLTKTFLRSKGYKFVVTHSTDPRGIDVALLYQSKEFSLDYHREHQIVFKNAPKKHSRNILEIGLRLNNGQKLHILLAHWPSRRLGVKQSEPLRLDVAQRMRAICDSLYCRLNYEERQNTHFILMGDFNEGGNEEGITDGLKAQDFNKRKRITKLSDSLNLYSLMNHSSSDSKSKNPVGSYCYKGIWSQLDHFIISESLILASSSVRYKLGSAINFYDPFLGSKHLYGRYPSPYRSYGGNFYLGGYSDHYPIRMELIID